MRGNCGLRLHRLNLNFVSNFVLIDTQSLNCFFYFLEKEEYKCLKCAAKPNKTTEETEKKNLVCALHNQIKYVCLQCVKPSPSGKSMQNLEKVSGQSVDTRANSKVNVTKRIRKFLNYQVKKTLRPRFVLSGTYEFKRNDRVLIAESQRSNFWKSFARKSEDEDGKVCLIYITIT